MRIRTDLHLHTIASDGTWSVEQLLENLVKQDIRLFSITDHDTVQNTRKAKELVLPDGFRFVAGVELSSYMDNMRYHILAYGFECNHPAVTSVMQKNNQATRVWFDKIVDYVASTNKNVSLDEFSAYKTMPSTGGVKAINYMLEKNVITTPSQFFSLAQQSSIMPDFVGVHDVVAAVKESGGVSFLAHPSEYWKKKMENDTLEAWLKTGIDGVECYHPSSSPEISNEYVTFCKRHGLLIAGGSDCHGDYLPARKLGHPRIYLDMLSLPETMISGYCELKVFGKTRITCMLIRR